MPNPTMPFADLQDSKFFSESVEDATIKTDIEGGYEFTRARFERPLRSSYTSGFTHLTQAQKDTLRTFVETVKGGSLIFDWVQPQSLVTIPVRFVKVGKFQYTGKGALPQWDFDFEVRTA